MAERYVYYAIIFGIIVDVVVVDKLCKVAVSRGCMPMMKQTKVVNGQRPFRRSQLLVWAWTGKAA